MILMSSAFQDLKIKLQIVSQLGCIKDNIVLPKLRVNAITQQLSNPDDVIHDIRLETAKDDGQNESEKSQKKCNLTGCSEKN